MISNAPPPPLDQVGEAREKATTLVGEASVKASAAVGEARDKVRVAVQGYLAHKKQQPPLGRRLRLWPTPETRCV